MSAPGAPLALSLGDPAGIGPEVTIKAYAACRESGPRFMVVGDHDLLSALARGDVTVRRVSTAEEATAVFPSALPVLDLPLRTAVVAGRSSPEHGDTVIQWIETAVSLVLTRACSGVVTCPVQKSSLYQAGFRFPGHTEFLADLAGGGEPAQPIMMMASPRLKASLVTIHSPLREVAASLTTEAVFHAARVTCQALIRDFGVEHPRVALAGLNPHAGEGGRLGDEEGRIINPAAERLRSLGHDVSDARSADTLFHEEARGRYDAVVCMYHDQALIPLKMLDFWNAVNVTLGLPIVRTSPDHGVGLDIAGRGLARADSLIAAIRMAADIARRRQSAVGLRPSGG